MPRALRIAAWHANGLLQRIREIQVFLWNQKIGVCLISEAHLTRQAYPKIKGYKIYHTIRLDKIGKGGSTVLVQENIKHYEDNWRTDIEKVSELIDFFVMKEVSCNCTCMEENRNLAFILHMHHFNNK